MKFFDASRYASPLRKALAKKENAPRNLRFETLENRALLSVTPLDELQAAVASAEIAPAQTVETPVVDLSVLAVSNATVESNADDQYEGETGNNTAATATQLGTLTQTTTIEAFAGTNRELDYYRVKFDYVGTDDDYLRLETHASAVGNFTFTLEPTGTQTISGYSASVVDGAKVIKLAGLPKGEYLIKVSANTSSTLSSPYTLTIEPPKPETDDRYENVSDEVDNNDSAANAYDLDMVGDLTLDAKAGPSRDADYFKFTMVGTGTADHQIALSTAANAVLNFRVFKEGATDNVDSAILSTMTSKGSAVLSLEGLAAGDYYVLIDNNVNVDSFVKYSLTFDAPKDAPAEPTNLKTNGDEAEYNYTTLSWNAVDYVTGYELRYTTDVDATDAEANWKTVGTVAADVTEFTTDKLGLAYGTEYKFQVRALRVAESAHDRSAWDLASDWSDALVFSTVDAPEPPTGLKASVLDPETLTVELSWDDVDHELGYKVELFEDPNVVAQSYLLPAGTTRWTPFVDASDPNHTTRDKLSLGTTYEFRVTAYNNAAEHGVPSEIVSFTTENVPTAPTGESWTLVPAPQPTATLSWNAVKKASDAEVVTDYVVTIYEQVDGADGDAIFTQTVDAAQTSLTLEAGVLEKGASYRFAVVAVNAYGESAPSTGEGAYVTVGDVPTQPTVPTATVNPSTAPTATLTWGAVASETVAETVTGYEVTLYQIVVDADGETTVVAFEPQTVTEATYTTETLDFGGTYYFEVAAVNVYGASEVAKSENFTVGTVPTAPTELTADLDEAALTASLSWTAASNHTGYRVELQTQNADGETVWEIVDNLDADALTWSTDVAVDTTYLYRVVAWSAYGKTASETVEVVVENVPTQPTDVKYSVDYVDKAATLTWTAVDGATGYVVEQLGADGEWTSVAGSETTATTWESGAFDFGTSYSFRVVAKNAYGSSDASDAVSFTIQDAPTVVTSLADGLNLLDDVTTLREALHYAQDGAEIVFDESLRGGTIALTGGELIIQEKEISVRGFVDETGAPDLAIDGDYKSMVFYVYNTRASFFGLTVVNGVAPKSQYGGGAYGGGFCFDNANAILTNVDVIGCQADIYGGGVYIGCNAYAAGEGKSTLTNVRIIDNVADNGSSSGQGGGLYATGSFMGGELEMTNVEISGNQTQGDGGGIFLNDITSTLTNVKITDNTAEGNGGAFYATAPDHPEIHDYPSIVISTKLTNVEISGNKAYRGFGFSAKDFDVEELSLRNVTFADNVGMEDGAYADVYLANGNATFYNSIVDGAVQGTTDSAANAYNTLSSFTGWANATEDGVVNYEIDATKPLFADAANGDYTLAENSQAINKGADAYVPETLTTDLAGADRFNGTVDLGAYEDDGALPLAPTNVTLAQVKFSAADGTFVRMKWADVESETGYRVEYREAGTEVWTAFELKANAQSQSIYDFTPGETYEFRVRAENVYGASDWATASFAPMVAPTVDVALVDGAAKTATLALSAPTGATQMRVEVSTEPFATEAAIPRANLFYAVTLKADATSATLKNLEPGATYYYRVYAINANGTSDWCDTATFALLDAPSEVALSQVKRSNADGTHLRMKWADVADETGYRVEYRELGTEAWTAFALKANAQRYEFYDFTPGQTYEFRVRAENAYGVSAWTTASVAPLVAPTAEVVAISETAKTATLALSAPTGATQMRVEVSTKPFATEAAIPGVNLFYSGTYNADATSATIKNLAPDATYYTRVYAINADGVSDWCDVLTFSMQSAPSDVVFTADETDATRGVVSWTNNAADATEFRVEISEDGVVWELAATTTETSVELADLTPGEELYLRIRSQNAVGASAWSQGAILNAPTNLTFSQAKLSDEDGTLTRFKWNNASDLANLYRVEYREAGTDAWTFVAYRGSGSQSQVVYDFTPGQTYEFRVRAENAYGASAWSTSRFTPLVAPTVEVAAVDSTSFTLAFSAPENATTMRVEILDSAFPTEAAIPGVNLTRCVTLSADAQTWTPKKLTPGATYYVRVYAINAAGASDWCDVLEVTLPAETLKTSDAVSEAFAELFADDAKDDFWFELEASLGKRK